MLKCKWHEETIAEGCKYKQNTNSHKVKQKEKELELAQNNAQQKVETDSAKQQEQQETAAQAKTGANIQGFNNPNNPSNPKNYSVSYSERALNIDGEINEDQWESAEWSDDFIDIEGNKKPAV